MANGKRIRDWATANGYSVAKRGRIKPDIKKAYFEANPGDSDGGIPKAASLKGVREWAIAQGFNVARRGRVPADILQAYRRAVVDTGDVCDAPDSVVSAFSPDEKIDRLMMLLESRGNALWQQKDW